MQSNFQNLISHPLKATCQENNILPLPSNKVFFSGITLLHPPFSANPTRFFNSGTMNSCPHRTSIRALHVQQFMVERVLRKNPGGTRKLSVPYRSHSTSIDGLFSTSDSGVDGKGGLPNNGDRTRGLPINLGALNQ